VLIGDGATLAVTTTPRGGSLATAVQVGGLTVAGGTSSPWQPLASGAKALVCKGEQGFVMFVLPADRKLDSHAVRRAKGWRKLRFATREEVLEMTGLAPGSIPPFGSLFGLPTFCDERLGQNDVINFNAGDHSISVSMRYADYVLVEKPELGTFAE
jgi:Ala-tRNA(Pro) deacylase